LDSNEEDSTDELESDYSWDTVDSSQSQEARGIAESLQQMQANITRLEIISVRVSVRHVAEKF
jgi:hypothetical protein